MPKTRNRAIVGDDTLGVPSNKTATEAQNTKTAVVDAKNHLRQVRQTGRQTVREVKLNAAQNIKVLRGGSSSAGRVNTPASADIAKFSQKQFVSQRQIRLSNLNPLRRKTVKAPVVKPAAQGSKTTTTIDGNPIKNGILHPNYTTATPKGTSNPAQTLQNSAETVKSTMKNIKETAKGTIKSAKKSVKTAEKSAKVAVKTAKQTAKTAHKTTQTTAKTARAAEHAARAAAKTTVQTVKDTTKAVIEMVKVTTRTVKGLISAIAAGGWIAVLVILIISMIALLAGSIFGIFFSGEPSERGKTINSVITEIDAEYTDTIDSIIVSNAHDLLDMSGARASWKEVLAVYTVKTVTDPDNPMEVATIDDEKATLLRSVFWEMNTISYTLNSVDIEEDVLDIDGLPTGETITVTTTVLKITVTHKTPIEMAVQYGFTNAQITQLDELLKPDYHYLWNALLYGITSIGDGSMVSVAETQLGNVGGEQYWRWYGFTDRVEWCAIFVSWVAEQCGYIDAGIIPRFSACATGVQWFIDRGQWQNNSYIPRIGDIIYFDWEGDGICDHVGIVESVSDGRVNTIEGNSSDRVARRSCELCSVNIFGYGCPSY